MADLGRRRVHGRLRVADRWVLQRTVRESRRPAGGALSAATVAGDGGFLWLAIAAALTASGGRSRRAGVAGLAALGAVSTVSEALKHTVRRERPPRWTQIGARSAGSSPSNPSFPSGHSANGAAFTMAVGLQTPVLGLALVPVTALVSVSRLATAKHHPSDALGSLLIGAGVGAAAGVVVRRYAKDRTTGPDASAGTDREERAVRSDG